MIEFVDDETIREGFRTIKITPEETARVAQLIKGWTDVTDSQKATVRVVFLACVQIIATCGPAWCRIAIATLSQRVN